MAYYMAHYLVWHDLIGRVLDYVTFIDSVHTTWLGRWNLGIFILKGKITLQRDEVIYKAMNYSI